MRMTLMIGEHFKLLTHGQVSSRLSVDSVSIANNQLFLMLIMFSKRVEPKIDTQFQPHLILWYFGIGK